ISPYSINALVQLLTQRANHIPRFNSCNLYPEVKCSLSSFSLFSILLINAFLLALSDLELPPEPLEELPPEEPPEEPPLEKPPEEPSPEEPPSKLLSEEPPPNFFRYFVVREFPTFTNRRLECFNAFIFLVKTKKAIPPHPHWSIQLHHLC
ncbi:3491_t:CDS:2, partial [Funneliformis caledonium]